MCFCWKATAKLRLHIRNELVVSALAKFESRLFKLTHYRPVVSVDRALFKTIESDQVGGASSSSPKTAAPSFNG
jgi:hypothetical protein